MTTLADLDCQERVRVLSVGDATQTAQRLLELGFVPGTMVKKVGRSPCGGCGVYEVRGARFALRCSEARQVVVARVTAAAQQATTLSLDSSVPHAAAAHVDDLALV